MKICLIYFTGTYNTTFLTTLIKNAFLASNYEVDTFCYSNKLKINVDKYDFIGIGYPIHAFNAPKVLENKIKELKIKNKKYFIYKDSGEPFKLNNASSNRLVRILKNNEFHGEYHFLMPYNILFKTKEDFIRYELEYDIKLAKYLVKHINDIHKYRVNIFYKFISFIFKIYRLGAKINIKFYKFDKDKCIKCRKCSTSCPTNNIIYNKETHQIEFGNNCIMCMRCSFNCPGDAISIGLLNKYKVNGSYDLIEILKKDNNYNIDLESDKFYKKFKKYFKKFDNLLGK